MEDPKKYCEHLNYGKFKTTRTKVCEECVKTGGKWIHLRHCQTCGAVLCCNSSQNQHAQKHFEATGHPVVTSILPKPWSKFAWCYIDKLKRPLN
ncbi:UBP-type zinc finger domain-containing protein [Algoriphagus sp. AGSA1]|uniref:UBP-type zinc finger domain-containing protein n=1 Tax=Algoriphagus sp. AGSA1 TaxID=2907213 RepID=UPI001F1C90C9|nr:UBP-type zinc finger domain-containing protein [Algoriphagus sp. AGSA1]MCE7054217.1 UBP-type zinc finger domain-containing protein [Algoriphagus sp. AGSA1]